MPKATAAAVAVIRRIAPVQAAAVFPAGATALAQEAAGVRAGLRPIVQPEAVRTLSAPAREAAAHLVRAAAERKLPTRGEERATAPVRVGVMRADRAIAPEKVTLLVPVARFPQVPEAERLVRPQVHFGKRILRRSKATAPDQAGRIVRVPIRLPQLPARARFRARRSPIPAHLR